MARARTLVLLPRVLSAPGGFDRSVLAHEATHHLLDHLWPRRSGKPDEHLAVLKEALADYGAASFLDDPIIDRDGPPRDMSAFASLDAGVAPADGTAPAYLQGQPLRWLLWQFRGRVGADRADRLAFTALADLASSAELPGAGDPALLIQAYLEAFQRGISISEKESFRALASAIGARVSDSAGSSLAALRTSLPGLSSLALFVPEAWTGAPGEPSVVEGAPSGSLAPGRWLPKNKERLERLIAEHGRGGTAWDPSRPPLATFDWDNTVIRNDIGEAVFFHAIREMRFKFELGDRFWDLIPERYGREELRSAVASLTGLPLEQAKHTPQYRRYRKLFHRMYEEIKRDGASLNIDYGWLVQLMVGFTEPELQGLSDEVIALETGRPLGTELVSESDNDPDPVQVPTGIRIYPEMADLVSRLIAMGWEVRIVSATAEQVVARFAARLGIPLGRVHGARVRLAAGVLTTELTQRTWRQGKADVILREAGRPSELAGGDSNSDREMLALSRGERLVIDLGREPLRSEALSQGWLLQPPFVRPSSP
ncbi:MAG: hypothetical protein HZB91_02950 [Elusimicrobia bacterium]|nr:hypothetical protein [Elusimicrobiota bacterium]